MTKLFLTGRPRCGKSTLIQNSLKGSPYPLGGFAVQRLTWVGMTWAFRLIDLREEDYVTHLESSKEFADIAICMLYPGKWQGISAVFDTKGRLALERCLDKKVLVVMDELGIFERDAFRFQKSVLQVLDSKLPVLGVLKDKSNPFLDAVRQHSDVKILDYPSDQVQDEMDNFLGGVGRVLGWG